MSNPVINGVIVDSAVTEITVSGSGFQPASSAPQVRLGGTVLTVSSYSDSSFVALLPSGIGSGSYLLEVENSDSFTNTTDFDVFIPSSVVPVFSDAFRVISNTIFGSVQNAQLSSTPVSFPLVGIGETTWSGSGNAGIFRITLLSALPSSAGDLEVSIENVTTSTSTGPLSLTSGQTTNVYGGSLPYSAGDQLIILFSVTGSSVVVPSIHWYIGSEVE